MTTMPVHSFLFRHRRFWNWFPLGGGYAALYSGRYNLTVSKTALGDIMSKTDFGTIFFVGAWVYALSFLVNGPLIDKIGGRKGMLIGMLGACLANLGMGVYLQYVLSLPNPSSAPLVTTFSILYGVNMYFQSYGAVSIVKVNAPWFHVRERGRFSGIFGIMIASGLFLAFDLNNQLLNYFQSHGLPGVEATYVVFFGPAMLLGAFFVLEIILLRNLPSEAGHLDFDTGDASSGKKDEKQPPVFQVLKKVITNPIILTIALVEFCTGILRNGVMHWYPIFAKEHIAAGVTEGWKYVNDNWGLMLMVAGVVGGMVGGYVSDKVFQSRRAPSAGFFYATCFVAALLMIPFLQNGWGLGVLIFLMSTCVIGTHGLLSGTATMDFGGTKGAGTAVGIIDGFVYLGTGVQSLALGYITTHDWRFWPVFLAPFAFCGFYLLTRIWYALPPRVRAATVVKPR